MKKKIVTITCLDCGEDFEMECLVDTGKEKIDLSEVKCPGFDHRLGGGYNIKKKSHRVEEINTADFVNQYNEKAGFSLPTSALPVVHDEEAEAAARHYQQEEERKERKRVEKERQAAEERLKINLHSEFFRVNPNANEADFDRLYPQLRDRMMVESMSQTSRQNENPLEDYMREFYGS